MSSDTAISIQGLSKCYQIYEKPRDRLLQMLIRGRKQYYREFWALRDVSFNLKRGEVLGIVGKNGAGKSTLLQLICGTLNPTHGDISVHGRVAALLELGAGFNPEFTGRENVYLSATVMGLSKKEIDERYEKIVAFSGIGEFIDQPVKTYSSGMYVRLAFSVATSVEPDILIIDEALSVGDGDFSRKSFDRIMTLKERGATVLFCSHSMYMIEAFCDRAIWLEKGITRLLGAAQQVVANFQASLDREFLNSKSSPASQTPSAMQFSKSGKIIKSYGSVDGNEGTELHLVSLKSSLKVIVEFMIDPALPMPSVALGITNAAGLAVASVSSANDRVNIQVGPDGRGRTTIIFPALPLLKGTYYIATFVACEQAIHVYDVAERAITLHIAQEGLDQGIVALSHEWHSETL